MCFLVFFPPFFGAVIFFSFFLFNIDQSSVYICVGFVSVGKKKRPVPISLNNFFFFFPSIRLVSFPFCSQTWGFTAPFDIKQKVRLTPYINFL